MLNRRDYHHLSQQLARHLYGKTHYHSRHNTIGGRSSLYTERARGFAVDGVTVKRFKSLYSNSINNSNSKFHSFSNTSTRTRGLIMPSKYAVSDESDGASSDPYIDDLEEGEENAPSKVNKKETVVGIKRARPKKDTKSTENSQSVLVSAQDGRSVEEIYQKKTQLEHILLRPDTYIGSVERQDLVQWVFDKTLNRMVQRTLSFVPGLFKIFDEILVNAADNKIRDPSMDTLKVEIDRAAGKISVYNNGRGIPIEMHKKEKMYVPELIFGHLLTSSNYDDKEKKVTGGRNGYGAKLCNIFSTEFIVETADRNKRKKYRQIFSNNMGTRGEPLITDSGREEDFTRISFRPDLAKFGMTELDDDIVALFERRVYDLAGCVSKVKVFLNGERIPIKTFKEYIELYLPKSNPSTTTTPEGASPAVVIHEKIGDRWELCVTASDGSFQQMSFVNSICTYKGGIHVNYIVDQITSAVSEQLKKRHKDLDNVKPAQIKNHLMVFINCLIENPTFDSQTKEYMTLRASAFGSECKLGPEFIKKVLKCGVVENVSNWAKFKQSQQLKKTDGAKRNRLTGISKLDDANNAGSRNASQCTLIITEGDSAKALAVSGLSVVGRDNYGVFPLRGKLLNVREATHKQILENAEINNIKQILGLQHGQNYTSVGSLRYGSLMIMTDQDHDGSHIKGLVINFLDHFFPSLLRIPGFLVEFITPIVKVTRGRDEIAFYTIPEYEAWKAANDDGSGWNIKYYKGLGTSTAADARKYFAAMKRHRKIFAAADETDRQLVDMAFNKKRADERKEWLKTCTSETFMDHSEEVIRIADFINKELILFSMADNIRSIPSVVDGLKPGHRKILFSCFKRKLKGEIKVAQLSGYVAEHSAYHHGEQSLCATIIGMAQNFVGSNNLNLLEPIGQFGTRLQGGKDAASPRYVYTSLSPLARLVFKSEDDALLRYLNDDGQSIEPQWYMPIIPMVLVNGGEGIGTGWMTAIPNYNPRDIVHNLRKLMAGMTPDPMHPWYHGFRGSVEPLGTDRYKVSGVWHQIDDTTLEITELPVGTWTQSFKEMLETMVSTEGSGVKDYKEHHTDTTVHFIVHVTAETMNSLTASGTSEAIEKRFKLSTLINLNNLVCFDVEGRLKKYASPLAILEEFYHLRLDYYGKRKEWLVQQLTREWSKLDNKVRFIEEIIRGQLIVQNRKKDDIINDLSKRGYALFESASSAASASSSLAEDENNDDSEATSTDKKKKSSYDYLLTMPIYNLTKEKVDKLMSDRTAKEAELNALLSKRPKDLWESDLNEFMVAWDRFEVEAERVQMAELAKAANSSTAGKGKATRKVPVKKMTTNSAKSSTAVFDLLASGSSTPSGSSSATSTKPSTPIKTSTATKTFAMSKPLSTKPPSTNSLPAKPLPTTSLPSTIPVVAPTKILTEEELNNLPLSERINYMLNRNAATIGNVARKTGTQQSTLDSLIKKPATAPIVVISDEIPMNKVEGGEVSEKQPAAKRGRPRIVLDEDQ